LADWWAGWATGQAASMFVTEQKERFIKQVFRHVAYTSVS